MCTSFEESSSNQDTRCAAPAGHTQRAACRRRSGWPPAWRDKDGALTGPDKEHAETSMLALHLLQSALAHVNTLLLQQVLAEPAWADRLGDEDRRGLTALFWSNINPYGTFRLDMDQRLDLAEPVTILRPRPSARMATSLA
ncbi:Tn3 family transposase [Streptomyces sp. NPDC059697]|uniref:Tn3 family transposase n=1 Tax=Streptomyces sp. NPDC059697 TaxID=3346912 RepID=UPI0036B08D7C